MSNPAHPNGKRTSRPTRYVFAALAALAFIAIATPPGPAAAMTVLKASLPELVDTSALVLHAKVAAVTVRDRRKEGSAVWTRYDLDVIEVYKGDRMAIGPRFTFELLGGATADGMTLSVPGMPGFTAGEEVVVLLERHAEGYTLTGAPQGKWTVYRGADKVARVIRELDHAHIVERSAAGTLVAAPHPHTPLVLQPPAADRTLESLRAEILSLVHAAAQLRARTTPSAATGAVAPRARQQPPRRMARPPLGSAKPAAKRSP